MPASLTILPHLPSWILIKSANSGGELENASKPTLPSVDLISGESMILRSSRLSRPTTSGDVCAGATIPAQESMSGALRCGYAAASQLAVPRAADSEHRHQRDRLAWIILRAQRCSEQLHADDRENQQQLFHFSFLPGFLLGGPIWVTCPRFPGLAKQPAGSVLPVIAGPT